MDVERKNWKLLYSTVGDGSRWASSSPVKDSKRSTECWVLSGLLSGWRLTHLHLFIHIYSFVFCLFSEMNALNQTSAPATVNGQQQPASSHPLRVHSHRLGFYPRLSPQASTEMGRASRHPYRTPPHLSQSGNTPIRPSLSALSLSFSLSLSNLSNLRVYRLQANRGSFRPPVATSKPEASTTWPG